VHPDKFRQFYVYVLWKFTWSIKITFYQYGSFLDAAMAGFELAIFRSCSMAALSTPSFKPKISKWIKTVFRKRSLQSSHCLVCVCLARTFVFPGVLTFGDYIDISNCKGCLTAAQHFPLNCYQTSMRQCMNNMQKMFTYTKCQWM
jgi:hypothetical protein